MILTHAAVSLTQRLAIALPIIQAPMAGVSSPRMAAAVSNEGGLGSIALGTVGVDEAARMIVEARERTAKPFNVNVFCHRPAIRDASVEEAWLKRLSPQFGRLDVCVPQPRQLTTWPE